MRKLDWTKATITALWLFAILFIVAVVPVLNAFIWGAGIACIAYGIYHRVGGTHGRQ